MRYYSSTVYFIMKQLALHKRGTKRLPASVVGMLRDIKHNVLHLA